MEVTVTNIGKWIYDALTTDNGVKAIVKTKVWPYVAPEPQDLPWCIWDNLTINYADTKDKSIPESATMMIVCATASASQGITLADAVVTALNHKDDCSIESVRGAVETEIGIIHEITIKIDL